MNVLLYHCAWNNKGDVLMLLSAREIFKKIDKEAQFFVLKSDSPNMNLLNKYNIKIINLDVSFGEMPKSLNILKKIYFKFKKKEIYKLRQTDVILDVNGYFCGGKWDFSGVNKIVRELSSLKNTSKAKVVLMPKSFGPFDTSTYKGTASSLLNLCDLVFARDKESYASIKDLFYDQNKLFLSSDYTSILGVPKPLSKKVLFQKDKVAIIVNKRMTYKNNLNKQLYSKFLHLVVNYVKSKGKDVYFLIHDSNKDLELAKILGFGSQYDFVATNDPLELKAYASTASLVVSSRYHGILNALNTSTPVLGTSWAHKYKYIMIEYGVEDFLVNLDSSEEQVCNLIDLALDKKQYHIEFNVDIEQKRLQIEHKLVDVISENLLQ